jgi:competence protein ComEC
MAALEPAIAVISVGADNDYGHPSATTVGLLARVGATVFRTDRDGDIAVGLAEDRVVVAKRGP